MLTELKLNVGTCRGRYTEGWTMVTLVATSTGKRYRARGGGYDMHGTVLGDFLEETYQMRLRALAKTASSTSTTDKREQLTGSLLGMYLNHSTGAVTLDGACGIRSILSIAKHIGIAVEEKSVKRGKRRGQVGGYTLVDSGMPLISQVPLM
jgi:hypothetical protein